MFVNSTIQARIALKSLGFTENKIKRILQTKKDVTDIMLIDEINENLEMLETAIIIEDLNSEIKARHKTHLDKETREDELSEALELVAEYDELIKDTKTNLILIEGHIRQRMLNRTS